MLLHHTRTNPFRTDSEQRYVPLLKIKNQLKKTVFTFGFCFSIVLKRLSPRCIERQKVRAPCYLVKKKN